MSTLSALLKGFVNVDRIDVDVHVSDITLDSRTVQTGSLFIALQGEKTDGRDYILAALEQGAAAVLIDNDQGLDLAANVLASGQVIIVPDLLQNLSEIAARFYDHPSEKLDVIGMTGTNGKTSVAYFSAQTLEALGCDTALMGTLGAGRIGEIKTTGMTTPDAVQTQKILATFVEAGVQTVCMEVSSHGLALGRVKAVKFKAVVFTNLSQDHLDFHLDMQAYADAKARLFNDFEYDFAIINQDDVLGQQLIKQHSAKATEKVWAYGIEAGELIATEINLTHGLSFNITYQGEQYKVHSALVGEFNIYNLLAVIGIGISLNYSMADMTQALANISTAPGRMEPIQSSSKNAAKVVVDFAHTPDALENALSACRAHCVGKLSVVFGCGGDRDKTKRAQMGRIAESLSDTVFITDDNPRGEQPAAIVRDILSGMKQAPWVVHDRAQAIQTAVVHAAKNDWVLIAGKGSEAQQIYRDHRIEMDDRDLARAALEGLAA
ncbi:MAG: UDP-N-acetylmuramoyl-L-alanyl-D-glutamate--2,6-diaminopimelate ligase [Arenicellales bacterium]